MLANSGQMEKKRAIVNFDIRRSKVFHYSVISIFSYDRRCLRMNKFFNQLAYSVLVMISRALHGFYKTNKKVHPGKLIFRVENHFGRTVSSSGVGSGRELLFESAFKH